MKRIKKFIAPLILSFLLLGVFFVGSSQNANAITITIIINGGLHGFGSDCQSGGSFCMTISTNIAVHGDITGDGVLTSDLLTLTFAPNKMLASMSDADRQVVLDQDVQLDSDICQLFGVPSITIKAGTYPVHIDDCTATVSLKRLN